MNLEQKLKKLEDLQNDIKEGERVLMMKKWSNE